MKWVRIEAAYPNHPQTRALGPACELVHVRAYCYSAQYLTNGFIPADVVPSLLSGISTLRMYGRKPGVRGIVTALVSAGWWQAETGGYRLADYLQVNPTRDEYEQLIADRREAGRRGGLARGQARAQARATASAQALAQAKSKHVTLRNEDESQKLLSVDGSNDAKPSDEPVPEAATNGHGLTLEQIKADRARLERVLTRPAAHDA